MAKKESNSKYERKQVDFYKNIEFDQNLRDTFFSEERYLHPQLANVPLAHGDVLKAALHYFYRSVILEQKNQMEVVKQRDTEIGQLKQEIEQLKISSIQEQERLKKQIEALEQKTRRRHETTMKKEVNLQ